MDIFYLQVKYMTYSINNPRIYKMHTINVRKKIAINRFILGRLKSNFLLVFFCELDYVSLKYNDINNLIFLFYTKTI